MKVVYMDADKKSDSYYGLAKPFYISDGKYQEDTTDITVNCGHSVDTLYIDCNHRNIEIIANVENLNIHIIGNLSQNNITIFSYNQIDNLNIFGERVQKLSIRGKVKNLSIEPYIYHIDLPIVNYIEQAVFITEPTIVTNQTLIKNLISKIGLTLKTNYKNHYDIDTLVSIDGKYDVKSIPNIIRNIAKYIL